MIVGQELPFLREPEVCFAELKNKNWKGLTYFLQRSQRRPKPACNYSGSIDIIFCQMPEVNIWWHAKCRVIDRDQ